jgi:sugar phosphate isomerase/epimerase
VQAVLRRPDQTQKLSVPLPLAGLGRLGRWLLNDLPQFQKTTGVKIAIENMPGRPFGPLTLKPHHFASPAELNAFQYLTLDTTHVGTYRTDLLAFYGAVRRRLAHVHLSNYNGREHQRLDDGVLPLSDFVAQLARDNFGGLISVEFSPFSLQAQSETLLKQHLQASLSFCQRALAAEVEPP